MPQFLLIMGALLALVGLGSIAAGAPDWLLGLSLGSTLIQSGTIALVGGLVLVALGMVLYVLQDLLRRLDGVAPGAAAPDRRAIMPPEERAASPQRQPARPQQPAEGAPQRPREPAPVAEQPESSEPPRRRERREPAPETAESDYPPQREMPPRRERPRDVPFDETPRPREPRPEEMARQRRPAPPAMEDQRPRRPAPFSEEEIIPRARPRQPEPQFEDQPPRAPRPERPRERTPEEVARRPDVPPVPPIPTVPQPFGEGRPAPAPQRDPNDPYVPKFRPVEPAPPVRSPGSDTVVRSGVIGGMAYTLYVDGSIEAELPIGTVRFNSIAELQDHVMRTGTEADGDFDEQNR